MRYSGGPGRSSMNSWRRLWRFSASLRNEIPGRKPSQGESGIWIGGIPGRRRWKKLVARGIRTVIALTDEWPPPPWMQLSDLHWIRVPDHHSPMVDQFRDACARLDEAVAA